MFSQMCTLCAAAILICACSHTNELSRYDLDGQPVFFEELVAGDMSKVKIRYVPETPAEDEDQDNEHGKLEEFGTLARTVGTAVLTAETEEKLARSAHPQDIAATVSEGIEKAMTRYLRVRPSEDSDALYIVGTTLQSVELVSNPDKVYVGICAETEVIARGSGITVWEKTERLSVPLRVIGIPARRARSGIEKTASDVGQAVLLANISEEEIAEALFSAARELGQRLAESLRTDIAEARASM